MSLLQWLTNGWLRRHKTTAEEIGNLFAIVRRDLQDARCKLSCDGQFATAYNAALQLCAILLYAEGFRPEKNLQHHRTIMALPLILGGSWKGKAEYLDTCRDKRNTAEYDYAGGVSETDVHDLLALVEELHVAVTDWLKASHPDLTAGSTGR